MKDDLEALAASYSKLPDKIKPSDATDPKKSNGEDYEPVCDKYYPLDYQQMLGLPALLPPLMTVPVVDYYMYDNTVNFVMDSNEYDGFLLNQAINDVPYKDEYWTKEVVSNENWEEDEINSNSGDIQEIWVKHTSIISSYYELKEIYRNAKYAPLSTWTEIEWVSGIISDNNEEENINDEDEIDEYIEEEEPEEPNIYISGIVHTYNLINVACGGLAESNASYFGKKNTWNAKISLMDGYAYVPIGIYIDMEYTGIPIFKNSIIIPGIGFDYGTTLAGAYKPYKQLDYKLIEYYPYQNTDPDGKFYWLQTNFINPLKVAKLNDMFTDPEYEPLVVSFRIYEKIKLSCGFPKKCGEMTQEELDINGICGLQQFLNNPPLITPELAGRKKYDPKEIYGDAYEKFKKYKKKLKDKQKDTWNIAKQLKDNIFNRDVALQNFMTIANNMFPAMDFIDINCIKNKICEAQRKAQGESSIKGLSDSLKNNAEATKLLLNDVADSIDKAATEAVNTIGDFTETATNGLKNLANTFNIFQLCPRRFKDWLMDAGEAMGLPIGIDPFTQLQNIFSAGIIKIFKELLGDCMNTSIGQAYINNAKNISASQKRQLLTTFQSGDMNAFKNVVAGTALKKDLINSIGVLDLTKLYNTPSFNMGKLNSLGDSLGRSLTSFNLLNSSSDIFNLTKNLNNTTNNTERIYINM